MIGKMIVGMVQTSFTQCAVSEGFLKILELNGVFTSVLGKN